VSARITTATAARVMLQLRRDPRTVAMLLLVPCLLEVLLRYVLDGQPLAFQRVGTPLLGIFPFISMFLVTAITMLRERTTGTLERLMAMPLGKLDLLAGYGIAFGAVAAVRRRSRPASHSGCSTSGRPARSGSSPGSQSQTRCSGWRSACS
jgi:ABC-2 type transport system permease protein